MNALSQFLGGAYVPIGGPIQLADLASFVVRDGAEYLAHGFSVPCQPKYARAILAGLGEVNPTLNSQFTQATIVITGFAGFSTLSVKSNIEYGKINNVSVYAFLASIKKTDGALRWSRSFGQSPGRNKLRPVPGIWF